MKEIKKTTNDSKDRLAEELFQILLIIGGLISLLVFVVFAKFVYCKYDNPGWSLVKCGKWSILESNK